MTVNRRVTFTKPERARLRAVCASLGTSMPEFIQFATMQAVSECEGLAAMYRLHQAEFERISDGRN